MIKTPRLKPRVKPKVKPIIPLSPLTSHSGTFSPCFKCIDVCDPTTCEKLERFIREDMDHI